MVEVEVVDEGGRVYCFLFASERAAQELVDAINEGRLTEARINVPPNHQPHPEDRPR